MAIFSNLGNYKNTGLLITRVGLGIMFLYHGYPKVLEGPKAWTEMGTATRYIGIHFLPTFWGFMAACSETFGGFLLVIGLAFRPVCLLLLITLTVASLMHMATSNLDTASHAIEDAFIFAGLLFVGPGKYSVDKK